MKRMFWVPQDLWKELDTEKCHSCYIECLKKKKVVRLYYRLASKVEGKYDKDTRGEGYPSKKTLCDL